MKELLVALASIAVMACTASTFVAPTGADISAAKPDEYISPYWLSRHRHEVEDRVVSYITQRYPTIPPEVQGFTIGEVTVKNRARSASIASNLRLLFGAVESRVLGTRPDSGLVADIDVTFLTPQLSRGEEAAAMTYAVPALPVCFGTLFTICPAKMSNYVLLEAKLKRSGVEVATISGVGGASRYTSTIIVDDSEDPEMNGTLEANSKAMSAAVADLGAKLVPLLHK